MCGRYTFTQDLSELEKIVKFICKITDFKQRYNIAPRSIVPVLLWENGVIVAGECQKSNGSLGILAMTDLRWGFWWGWSNGKFGW